MKLSHLGIFGVISLLSYGAMVFFSPLAYPGYDWMSMAVSELSAVGAPSRELAAQLNSLFGPCAVVSIMAVCVAVRNCKEKLLRGGVYLFAVMEWLCTVGYGCFPWISDAKETNIQNILHIIVTFFVVLLSFVSLIMIFSGTRKSNLKSLGIWSLVSLFVMFAGAIGTNVFPKTVFGIFERMSTFSAVVFNAVLGCYLLAGRFLYTKKGWELKRKMIIETERLFLREMAEGDYDELYVILADSDIMQHYPYIFDEARVRRWISCNRERYRIFGFGLWAVCLKETGEMIGDCGLTMQQINGKIKPEIGYHMRKDQQRKGYAKEAAIEVRDWTFRNTPFNTIYSYMKDINEASCKTAISFGCKQVDEFEDDENEITKVYAISREEWSALCNMSE